MKRRPYTANKKTNENQFAEFGEEIRYPNTKKTLLYL
jgi:hypothetical protein